MLRPCLKTLIFALLLATPCLALADSPEQLHDGAATAKSLEWHELIPADWEPPIIAVAHDEATSRSVAPDALVGELDGQQVRLPGFMKPVVFTGRSVAEFLLVPYLPHHVKQHAHLDPNQMVYVALKQPLEVDDPFAPIWVSGVMHTQTTVTDEGPVGYKLTDAETTAYVY